MRRTFGSQKFRSLMPYLIFALIIIAAYRISGALDFFIGMFRDAWTVVSPFFFGFILAYIINIPIGGVQKLLVKTKNRFIIKRQRMFGVIIVFLLLAALVYLALSLIIPAIVDSIIFFIDNIPVYWISVTQFIDYINNLELFGLHISAERIFDFLGGMLEDFNIENLMQPIAALVGVGTAVFRGAIAFISAIYILIEKDKVKALGNRLFKVFMSKEASAMATATFAKLNNNFRQYVRAQTIDGVILGTMATVLLFALGSPYALLLGIMLGIVNYIPYFGSLFGTIVAVIVVTFTQGITMGLISTASLIVVQQIDANIVQPKLMSSSFKLSPLLVIISITIGGAIAGILGMIVAIPIVAVLKDTFDSIVDYYDYKKFGKPDEISRQAEPNLQAHQKNEDQEVAEN